MTDKAWMALNDALTGALKEVAWRFEEGVSDRVIADTADEMTDILIARWSVRPE